MAAILRVGVGMRRSVCLLTVAAIHVRCQQEGRLGGVGVSWLRGSVGMRKRKRGCHISFLAARFELELAACMSLRCSR